MAPLFGNAKRWVGTLLKIAEHNPTAFKGTILAPS
jgi:hypothetical protein